MLLFGSVILLIHYCVLSKKQMKRNTQTIQADKHEIVHYCYKKRLKSSMSVLPAIMQRFKQI